MDSGVFAVTDILVTNLTHKAPGQGMEKRPDQNRPTTRRALDKTIGVGIGLAVVFTALTHGAVEPWSLAIFELIVTTLIFLWVYKSVRERSFSLVVPLLCLPLGGLVVLGLIQGVSLTDAAGFRSGFSMDVEATRSAVSVSFFLLALSIIAASFFTSRERLRALATFLIIFGLLLAVFAIVQDFAWDGRFYWLRATEKQGFGPFVNRNHFAGYMEMLLPIPIALVVTRAIGREARVFYIFAAAMMGAAMVVSLSRGGMISLTAALIFLLITSIRDVKHRPSSTSYSHTVASAPRFRFAVIGVAAVAILAAIVWIGAGPVVDRILQTVDGGAHAEFQSGSISRGQIWKDTWLMIEDRPLLGVGLGAFETAYPSYSRTDGSLAVVQSHNDYLQVLADGGVIGGLFVLSFLILLFRAAMRAIRSRDRLMSGLALGVTAGIFAMLVHSLFDFNLQLPSNALLFMLLAVVLSNIASADVGNKSGSGEHRSALVTSVATGASL